MLYLIFSDVHSNLEALNRMLKKTKQINPDKYIFLGDLVGYGPNPNKVINKIRKINNLIIIRGNHDKVAADLESRDYFNTVAAKAIKWTSKKINKENKDYLKKLKKGPANVGKNISIFHGSYFNEDLYILSQYEALLSLHTIPSKISFFGHTHLPIIYKLSPDNRFEVINIVVEKNKLKIKLDGSSSYLINPGSIGQPRDKDPRISFITFDTEKREIVYYRYKYRINRTEQKIKKHKLPIFLAQRLSKGI